MYYAILYIGDGMNRHYQVRKVTDRGFILPITTSADLFKAHKTEAEAQEAAARHGLKIEKTGDTWHILPDEF